jgi:hypothetical protein
VTAKPAPVHASPLTISRFSIPELQQFRRLLDEKGVTLAEVLAVLYTRPKTLKALARGPQ